LTARILIADDHPLFREALRHVIHASFVSAETVEVRTFVDALEATTTQVPFDLIF
jgi:DNA-binding NarL/FixJ family response regulator